MHRLIYTSRSLIDADCVPSIVASSSDRNSRVGLTGVLWTGAGCFAQVLEGEIEPLTATVDRIRRDPRHTDFAVLLDRDVMHRQFGTWSMRSADDEEATAFMMGFALSQNTEAAERLKEIIIASIS